MKKQNKEPIDEEDAELDRILAMDDETLAKFEKTRAPRPSRGGREHDRGNPRVARTGKF